MTTLDTTWPIRSAFFRRHSAQGGYVVDAVAELNGRNRAGGSRELFRSPGWHLITIRWALEASIQLPVLQDISGARPEADSFVVVSVRYQR